MSRKINGAIRTSGKGRTVLKAKDERKLAEMDLSEEQLRRLQDKGAISGFVAEKEAEEQVTIRSLKEFLSDKSREEVEEMAAADKRSSARPYYEARLAELAEEE